MREESLDSEEEDELRTELYKFANYHSRLPSINTSPEIKNYSYVEINTPIIQHSFSKRSLAR